ncbi:5-formyltetrahydrofolate cyclo-ligase [Blastomonas sp.]|uniref:5-formyltetrahydrofolate cyclo-ligase n=1 Tax=Blastomonas sp. TaxID=1909299 RepID=UPI003593A8E0
MTSIPDQKRALRKTMRAARKAHWQAIPLSHRALVFSRPPRIAEPLLLGQTETVGLYCAMDGEAPTAGLARFLLDQGRFIALPWFHSRTQPMAFKLWSGSEDTLVPGPWGLQPSAAMPDAQPQALVMPLLAFDAMCQRLGQGGGHYDRYIAGHPSTRRIGLAWSVQKVEAVPVAPHDSPMHAVITEQRFFLREDQDKL